jgi:DNA replication and repair protein RecF
LDTDARFVVFHGQNAQGKTNALEAIWLLATLRPLRGHRLADLIGWSGEASAVQGHLHARGITHVHAVTLDSKGRGFRVDGDRVELVDYFRAIRAIAFQPADEAVVSGGPDQRRRWLDRAAFTARPAHLDQVRLYARVLRQKQAALRDGASGGVLNVLDAQLASAGAQLASRRQALLDELQPHVRALHRRITDGHSDLGVRLRTAASGDTIAEREATLGKKLAESRASELRRRTTMVGVQRDDVVITLDGHPARTFGSRGQVRSTVLALKLAELIAARERGDTPIFLIDDVSSELDRARTSRLVELLTELGTQVFATTTSPDHLGQLPSEDTRYLEVESGLLRLSVSSLDQRRSPDNNGEVDPPDAT